MHTVHGKWDARMHKHIVPIECACVCLCVCACVVMYIWVCESVCECMCGVFYFQVSSEISLCTKQAHTLNNWYVAMWKMLLMRGTWIALLLQLFAFLSSYTYKRQIHVCLYACLPCNEHVLPMQLFACINSSHSYHDSAHFCVRAYRASATCVWSQRFAWSRKQQLYKFPLFFKTRKSVFKTAA